MQRRHQKLIEIAPAPYLTKALRQALVHAALTMAKALQFRGLGTFEFLVDHTSGDYFFIEANPRLQVEHTITEAITGTDLVALQLAIAGGATLADLGLADGTGPATWGYAIQLRINAETMDANAAPQPASGTLRRFEPPFGPGVRIDTAAHLGYVINPAFDSLLAKLIVHTITTDFTHALRRTARITGEWAIDGCANNLALIRTLLTHETIQLGGLYTGFVDDHAPALITASAALAPPAAPNTQTEESELSPTVHTTTPPGTEAVVAPLRGSVVHLEVAIGDPISQAQSVATLEAMKMHHLVPAPRGGTVHSIVARVGQTLAEGQPMMFIVPAADETTLAHARADIDLDAPRTDLDDVHARHALGLDENRPAALAKRRRIHSRTARENVADLCDADSFIEYGALAVAAQRRRRSVEDLMAATPADGMVAGMGTVNADLFGAAATRCAVLAYDYTVLAGTQGHVNHKKKDRLFELAEEHAIPVVFFTEGGGGRPGDVDTDDVIMSWLDLMTFTTWPRVSGVAPRIAINSGRCFAGNAVIFGCADITIATANSNIRLAGPAMIEGGGLGVYRPEDIGPIEVQTANGVVDIACADEAEATALGRQVLSYFQGTTSHWDCVDQRTLRHLVPEHRLQVYDMRQVIDALADTGSVVELRAHYGVGLITALVRIEGRPFGLMANDPRHLGGAIDGPGGEKGARFLQLCEAYGLPVISLCDTPGYMVGPESEKTAAVRRGSRLIMASANLTVPLFTVVLRKAYGLGAQAMAGGSFHAPFFAIAWPTAEFGPMGLEGTVALGFRKELDAVPEGPQRTALYDELVTKMYEKGKGVSVAQVFEIDAVIDPMDTRGWLVRGLNTAGPVRGRARRYVDVW